jgi:hypothetical protein
MSKIPYRFYTPIPVFFYQSGILDPSKKNYKNRLCFIHWAIGRCYVVSSIQNGVNYDAYEFSCSMAKAAEESGLTADEMEAQFTYFVNHGLLIKEINTSKNRINRYKWDVSKFIDEKVIALHAVEQQNPVENRNQPTGEELKKSEPNPENRNQTGTDLRVENEEKSEQNPHFSRTKEQTSICLKETSKEKSQSEVSDENLFLSLKEKNLFYSSGKNESREELEGLQAYIEYREIKDITPKTLTRWLKTYSCEDIKETLMLMLDPQNKKISNPGGWMQKALDNGWARQERIKRQNREFAIEFKAKNKVNFLKINQRYCIDLRQKDKEFYFHVDPRIFETQLRQCL